MSTLNFNVGVLGHVDSGKTSLAKALSTIASTACFDKNPQSRERGITLDLGFSSFTIPSSDELKRQHGYDYVQYTLVDCPGHASLIRTIIGGAQIIDMMLLVVDIVKGVQTQTAECLIIGEICCNKMLIVLNKLDLIDEAKRPATIEKISKRLLKTLESTKFANSRIVAVAANQGAGKSETDAAKKLDSMSLNDPPMLNMDVLIETIKELTFQPERKNRDGPFLYSVDHCFGIKGQGTVLTGTVLNGHVKINDTIEIPSLKVQTKVKSIQVFRKPVEKAYQGDRCGMCISNFDSKQFERGVVCTPNYVRTCYGVIINVDKIKYFKSSITSGSKFHITIGHETLLGKITLFAEPQQSDETTPTEFDFNKEYIYVEEMNNQDDSEKKTETANESDKKESNEMKSKQENYGRVYALIDFNYETTGGPTTPASAAATTHNSVLCVHNSLVIGSKLDTDIHLNQCRIAFHGRAMHAFVNKDFKETTAATATGAASSAGVGKLATPTAAVGANLASLRVYKNKCKTGVVERRHDEFTVIGRALFKKETNIDLFVNMKVNLSSGDSGYIEAGFGQSGKFKVRIPAGLSSTLRDQLETTKPKKKGQGQEQVESEVQEKSGSVKIFLHFKRFIFDDKRKMVQ